MQSDLRTHTQQQMNWFEQNKGTKTDTTNLPEFQQVHSKKDSNM